MIGLVIALAGVVLAHVLAMPVLDGWSSVGIGIVLVGMAIFLMVETHGLLIGEAADPDVVKAIQDAVRDEPAVHHVNEVLTQHMGPSDILVNVSLDVEDSLPAGEIEQVVARLDKRLKSLDSDVKRVFVEIQSRQAHHGIAQDDRSRPTAPAA